VLDGPTVTQGEFGGLQKFEQHGLNVPEGRPRVEEAGKKCKLWFVDRHRLEMENSWRVFRVNVRPNENTVYNIERNPGEVEPNIKYITIQLESGALLGESDSLWKKTLVARLNFSAFSSQINFEPHHTDSNLATTIKWPTSTLQRLIQWLL
jgi:hypothetical protein